VIQEKREEMRPEERLERIRRDAAPFWNYNPALLSDGGVGMDSINVIGVEDKSASIYRDIATRTGENLTTTRDPHAITVLHTKHGLPLSALQQMEDFRRAYEEHLRRRASPLHIFEIADPRKAKTVFGLGMAFKFIWETGAANFYCKNDVPYGEPIPLGKGLSSALDKFISTARYIEMVERMVEAQISEIGKVRALQEIIQPYLEQPVSGGGERAEIERELRRLVKEYADAFLA